EALRSRPDLLIDTRRLAVKTDARVTPPGERATLRAKLGWVIVWAKYSAHAVGICHRIERPVELASAQADGGFERSPGPLDLRQLVCDSHEHDVGRLTHNDVFRAHAHNVQPLRGVEGVIDAACASVLSPDRQSGIKTTLSQRQEPGLGGVRRDVTGGFPVPVSH